MPSLVCYLTLANNQTFADSSKIDESAVMQRIIQSRANCFEDPLWNQMPPMYRQLLFLMLSGGVKASSHGTYMNGFLEFWRTMRRLGVSDEMVWDFPIRDAILQVYIINCALVRARRNVYGTI